MLCNKKNKGEMMKYYVDCMKCQGKGWYYVQNPFIEGDVVPDNCEVCDGTGKRETTEEYFELISNAGSLS